MNYRIALCLFILLSVFNACTPSQRFLSKRNSEDLKNAREISVLVLTADDQIRISSDSRIKAVIRNSGQVYRDVERGTMFIRPGDISDAIVIEGWPGPLSVNGNPYRGRIEIHNVLSRIYVINKLSIEEYLLSVVGSEIPASWPMEALKAQAVAARTYALYHLGKKKVKNLYDLDATTNFQVYKGMVAEHRETTDAVMSTRGIVVMSGGQPIVSYFHSSCGGHTADDVNVFSGDDQRYLRGVECQYCSLSPDFRWQVHITLDDIKNALKKKYRNVGNITGVSFTKEKGRVTEVEISHTLGKHTLPGNEFRLLFPPKMIRSLYFTSRKKGDGLELTGQGWGHGVGLCQWGARGLAEKGASYRAILNFYYSGVTVSRINTGQIAMGR